MIPDVLLDGCDDPFLGQEVMDADDANAFVDGGQHLGQCAIAARQRETDVEVLVDQHEVRVGVIGGVGLQGHPVTSEFEQRRAIVRHRIEVATHTTPHGGQLERRADLVELCDPIHVGEGRFVAAVGVALYVSFRMESYERIADRRPRDAQP